MCCPSVHNNSSYSNNNNTTDNHVLSISGAIFVVAGGHSNSKGSCPSFGRSYPIDGAGDGNDDDDDDDNLQQQQQQEQHEQQYQ